jgi:hypothetical protein
MKVPPGYSCVKPDSTLAAASGTDHPFAAPRTTPTDEAHADLADDATRTVRIDYRPVHTYTMTNEVKYIAPKARVYREVGDHLKPLWPRQCH